MGITTLTSAYIGILSRHSVICPCVGYLDFRFVANGRSLSVVESEVEIELSVDKSYPGPSPFILYRL